MGVDSVPVLSLPVSRFVRGSALLLLGGILLLTGCGSGGRAPIEDRHSPAAVGGVASERYVVRRGDTLYAIAFRFGMDFRSVAAANGIASPYTIYPGQNLIIRSGSQQMAYRPPRPAPDTSSARPAPVAAPATRAAPAPAPVTPSPAAPATGAPAAARSADPAPPLAAARTPPEARLAPVSAWRWPSDGPVTRRYSATVHKGIDIGGRKGDMVVAVAAGDVVYAGTGIVGFGELLIIKHDDVYLSAYGHNDRLLVAEGARVAAGQQIAEKGSTGTDVVKLHFEIRKEGKPIDPLQLLPRR